MTKVSPFRNPKALLVGVVTGVVFFAGTVGFYALKGPEYVTDSRPGSVTVRPIVKDNAGKHLGMALVFGAVGFYFGAANFARRQARKGETPKDS
ncbi:hypothetical protein WJT86_01405 [Microvirga sp. W0021]|uniref:Uncharacterized protein n=1 Tax=Hohaiivirga grylli TaxID=3133970 RepID=A0ABV0BFG6_9HYPH